MLHALARAAPPTGSQQQPLRGRTRGRHGAIVGEGNRTHRVPAHRVVAAAPHSVCRHRCTGVTGSRATRQPPTSETNAVGVVNLRHPGTNLPNRVFDVFLIEYDASIWEPL